MIVPDQRVEGNIFCTQMDIEREKAEKDDEVRAPESFYEKVIVSQHSIERLLPIPISSKRLFPRLTPSSNRATQLKVQGSSMRFHLPLCCAENQINRVIEGLALVRL
ncbi:hypothetical protein RIEGSTA812A_PEG_1011 [invertebrate metagenome]|uniref:Uncharacterized protein n=1 Tax=invertebrate metagenome TaxID=1711999 RepID=A0A484HBK9_9ZZZZ